MKKIIASLIAVSMAVAPMGMAMAHADDNEVCMIVFIDQKHGKLAEDYSYTLTKDGYRFVDENGKLYDAVVVNGKKYQIDNNEKIVEMEAEPKEEIVHKKSHKLRNAAIIVGAVAAGVAAYKYLGKECENAVCNNGIFVVSENGDISSNDKICDVCEAKTKMETIFSENYSKAKETEPYKKAVELLSNAKDSEAAKKAVDLLTDAKGLAKDKLEALVKFFKEYFSKNAKEQTAIEEQA